MTLLPLTKKEMEKLHELHRQTHDKREAYRINALILFGKDYSGEEVADALLISLNTAYRIADDYRDGGIEKVLATDYKGGQAKMTIEQEQEFCLYLNTNLVGTATEAMEWANVRFATDYTS